MLQCWKYKHKYKCVCLVFTDILSVSGSYKPTNTFKHVNGYRHSCTQTYLQIVLIFSFVYINLGQIIMLYCSVNL